MFGVVAPMLPRLKATPTTNEYDGPKNKIIFYTIRRTIHKFLKLIFKVGPLILERSSLGVGKRTMTKYEILIFHADKKFRLTGLYSTRSFVYISSKLKTERAARRLKFKTIIIIFFILIRLPYIRIRFSVIFFALSDGSFSCGIVY